MKTHTFWIWRSASQKILKVNSQYINHRWLGSRFIRDQCRPPCYAPFSAVVCARCEALGRRPEHCTEHRTEMLTVGGTGSPAGRAPAELAGLLRTRRGGKCRGGSVGYGGMGESWGLKSGMDVNLGVKGVKLMAERCLRQFRVGKNNVLNQWELLNLWVSNPEG